MENPFGSPKYDNDVFPLGATQQTREAIPGTSNLPNAVTRAKRLTVDSKTNLFITDPPPINKEAVNEIDSRDIRGIAAGAPGTFSQPGSSTDSTPNPISSPKYQDPMFG